MNPYDRTWITQGEALWTNEANNRRVTLQWAKEKEWGLRLYKGTEPVTEATFFAETETIEPGTVLRELPSDEGQALCATLQRRHAYRGLIADPTARRIIAVCTEALERSEGILDREVRRSLAPDVGADDVNRVLARMKGPYLMPADSSGIIRPTLLAFIEFRSEAACRVIDAALRCFAELASHSYDFVVELSKVAQRANVSEAFAWRVLDIALLRTPAEASRLGPPRDIERVATCGSLPEFVRSLPDWSLGPDDPDPHRVDRPWLGAPMTLGTQVVRYSVLGHLHQAYTPVSPAPSRLLSSEPLAPGVRLLDPGTLTAFGSNAVALMDEINRAHRAAVHTATLVLLRRLLEGCIIETFVRLGKEKEIRQSEREFKDLRALIDLACASPTLQLSSSIRLAKERLHSIRWQGGVAAHSRQFIATAEDATNAAVLLSPFFSELAQRISG